MQTCLLFVNENIECQLILCTIVQSYNEEYFCESPNVTVLFENKHVLSNVDTNYFE